MLIRLDPTRTSQPCEGVQYVVRGHKFLWPLCNELFDQCTDRRLQQRHARGAPGVKQAITEGRAMIAGFGERMETVAVGGHGLPG